MCLSIDANGWGNGKDTHVGVVVCMMKGEFDSHLQWPFKGEITVEEYLKNDTQIQSHYNIVVTSV